MEDADGALAVLHSLEEAGDRLLVVRSQEGGGEPETESPGGKHPKIRCEISIMRASSLAYNSRRATGHAGVPLEDLNIAKFVNMSVDGDRHHHLPQAVSRRG